MRELAPTPASVHGAVSGALEPVMEIAQGERVRIHCVDVGFGVAPPIDVAQPRAKILPSDECLRDGPGSVGPIAIVGAQPGTILAVTLHKLVPTAWGFTYTGGGFPAGLADALDTVDAQPGLISWSIDPNRGLATTDEGLCVPIAPFLGTIGLAPADATPTPGWAPRLTGGNLDCLHLVAGTTLYLPVAVSGGLLSLGDGHAAQGHGELGGMAIECGMEVELSARVLDSAPTGIDDCVTAQTPSGAVLVGLGETLDDAMRSAARRVVKHIQHVHGVDRARAAGLAGVIANFHITQVVNGVVGVHAVVGDLATDSRAQ